MYALGSEGLTGLTQQEVWIVPAAPAAQDFRLWADLPAILLVTGVAEAPRHNPPTPRAQPHIGKSLQPCALYTGQQNLSRNPPADLSLAATRQHDRVSFQGGWGVKDLKVGPWGKGLSKKMKEGNTGFGWTTKRDALHQDGGLVKG